MSSTSNYCDIFDISVQKCSSEISDKNSKCIVFYFNFCVLSKVFSILHKVIECWMFVNTESYHKRIELCYVLDNMSETRISQICMKEQMLGTYKYTRANLPLIILWKKINLEIYFMKPTPRHIAYVTHKTDPTQNIFWDIKFTVWSVLFKILK